MTTAKSDLTFDGLVHDLNNVFQTIIDAAELVGSDVDWAPISGIILRSVEQGRRIVSSIAGKDYGDVPLIVLAENAMAFAQDFVTAIRGPALLFCTDLPEDVYAGIKASALERVLVNLFINSSQAARSAGGDQCRIRIIAREEHGEVKIQVADDGPGIPEDLLPVVFAPGFSTSGSHSGLGLHIVHSLIASAGGSVTVSNGERSGAVFRITVPVARKIAAAAS